MRFSTALLAVPMLMLSAGSVRAATAFVSDELVLGVYAEQNGQGQRLATLHSGASVDTLSVNGEFTQVRLPDGTTGWVKTIYLTTVVPATVRVKQLEAELDRSRATTPALAEAAARSEVEQLKRELSGMQAATMGPAAAPAGGLAGIAAAAAKRPWMAVLALLGALGCGFWLGYATLASRMKRKFGGLKVY
ncbi:MAG: TIGR04211 family SH3 domain-containing protein [Steroidobacteraceae bacterium]